MSDADPGRPPDQGAAQDDAGDAAASQTVPRRCPPHQFPRPICARSATHDRGRHHDRGQPFARPARPVLRWAAEEDLIPVNFVPAIRRTPGAQARARADQARDQGDLARLRRSGHQRGGEELRPHGALLAADGTAPRRGRLASSRSYPQWRVAADGKQGEPPAQPSVAAAGADTGRARRRAGTMFSAGRSGGKIGAFSKLKRLLDKASGVDRLASARFEANRGVLHAGTKNPQRGGAGRS